MKKAKTKNLILILCALVSVVFAFSVFSTFSVISITKSHDSNGYMSGAYASNNQIILINDTQTCPVKFGEGTHNFDVSLRYSTCYDFDVRISYSLAWSNGASTNNVILNYANRDNLIVDDNYIYVAETILAGSGKLPIFVGVDFLDPTDENYVGANLTITVGYEKVIKTTSTTYSTSHALYLSNSPSAEGWLKYKNKSSIDSSAYVMVYNARYSDQVGVPYPSYRTAYKKDGSSTAEVVSSWLGGNRAYAGVGMYVIAKQDTSLTISVTGVWRKQSGSGVSVSDSNIKLNYSSNWTHSSWDTNKVFETRTFNYKISAGTAKYIEILDSIEITSIAHMDTQNYDAERFVLNQITLNNNVLTYTNSGILSTEIASVGSASTAFSTEEVKIINTSKFNSALYEISDSDQSFTTSITAVNNTNVTKNITISYSYKVRVGNGMYSYLKDGNRVEEVYSSSTDQQKFNNSDFLWYSSEISGATLGASSALDCASITISLAPYSAYEVCSTFSLAASLKNALINYYGGNYEAWVELVPTVSSGSETTYLTIETNTTSNSIEFYVKNNSNKAVQISGITEWRAYRYEENFTLVETKPADWDTSYWKYYVINSGKYTKNTNKTWSAGTYHSRTLETVIADPSFEITAQILMPDEMVKVHTLTLANAKNYIVEASLTGTAIQAVGVHIVNLGNKSYLKNYDSTSYFIRSETIINETNFVLSNGKYYYNGTLNPNMLVELTESNSVAFETVEATGSYSNTDIATIVSKFTATT